VVSAAPAVLTFDNVAIAYETEDGRRSSSHLAVTDISLEVREGEKFVIIGPSGCGKSTLLKAAAGFLRPADGQIRSQEKIIAGPGPDRIVVFQEFDQLFPWKTVRGNIAYALRLTSSLNGRTISERVERYVAMVGLTDRIDVYPHQLSGGQKQRVAIARSLAVNPDVLLMDEPFGALDAQTRARMQEELNAIWQQVGTTILFVTHDINEAVFLGHRILVMTGGPGRVRALLDNPYEGRPAEDAEAAAFGTQLRELLTEKH
jgi:NitT/TauT family transport system ATP-binding protein